MIYIPLELRLKMIHEDLQEIKNHITNHYPMMTVKPYCAECEFAKSTGLMTTCPNHAPELAMMIHFPF